MNKYTNKQLAYKMVQVANEILEADRMSLTTSGVMTLYDELTRLLNEQKQTNELHKELAK